MRGYHDAGFDMRSTTHRILPVVVEGVTGAADPVAVKQLVALARDTTAAAALKHALRRSIAAAVHLHARSTAEHLVRLPAHTGSLVYNESRN